MKTKAENVDEGVADEKTDFSQDNFLRELEMSALLSYKVHLQTLRSTVELLEMIVPLTQKDNTIMIACHATSQTRP
jgi:hypothetical protein